ncbi:MAG: thiamine pyrophosphate-binding protein [Deltaproteobacteria bacterium]|nr:thiamine pyrophosphate-binding protein [Deltaproteobacteria bacterium]
MEEKMRACDALVRVLVGEGVDVVFGIPGAHILPFFDALGRSSRIRVVLTRHEANAAYMARMYARATGKPGVCAGTSGPGSVNFVPGIAEAFVEQLPVILITGQVATGIIGMNADQEGTGEPGTPDQVALYRSMTRASSLVVRADAVVRKAREAFRLALGEPCAPVHLCIPSDIQCQEVVYEAMEPSGYRVTSFDLVDQDRVEAAAERLSRARRPALIIGHRAVFPNASSELEGLVEQCGIPFAATVVAKGLVSERHPMSLGVLHLFGHRLPERYLREADCVVAVGESFQENACNYYERELIPAEGVIHVDSCHEQIGKIYPVALAVPGSIRSTLRALTQALSRRGYRSPVAPEEIARLKSGTQHFSEPDAGSDAVPIKPQRFLAELARALPEGGAVAADIGMNFFWTLRYFEAAQGSYFGTWAFQPMGVAAGGAVGLSLARPGKPVVCICGDGAMQMNGMELMTAVQYSLPVTWAVFDDSRLNMVYLAQGLSYSERYVASEIRNPDFAAWGRAAGALGIRVERPEQIAPALAEALGCGGPCILDVAIDPDELPPLKPRSLLMARRTGLDICDSKIASKAFRKVLDER